jgi:CubicO group peptidase (beta-lactamase class C family)
LGLPAASLLALLLGSSLCARSDAVDEYVRATMRDLHVPGLSLAIVRDGRLVEARYYGLASLELRRAVTQDTVFEIGSVTKQFTAAAILMLVEEGRVALDAPLSTYLGGVPPSWSAITIRHLLTHSSGIPDYLGLPGFADISFHGLSHREIAQAFFEKLSPEFAPGATWAYSNTGYLLLGNVIEAASNKTYFDFLNERIFGPLGMRATRPSTPVDVIPNRASGYEWREGAYENRPALTENAYAAGSIVSTVRDLAKWEAALAAGRLLSKDSWRATWTAHPVALGVPPFDYGFGWFLDTVHGGRVMLHSGGTPGFSSAIHRFVEPRISVILLTNRGDRPLDHVAREVAAFYAPALVPTQPKDVDPARSERLRGILVRLLAGEADPDDFAPAMRAFLATPLGRSVWKWVGGDGPLASFTPLEEEASGDLHIVRYRVKLGQAALRFSFALDGRGRVARVTWW